MRMRSGTFVVIMLALVTSACGSPQPTSPDNPEWSVAADPNATAADVIAGGKPVGAVSAGDGSLLVLYRAESDDDEGPQVTAWQIRDADGNEIAARIWARVSEASSLPSVVRGLKDGFLIGGQLGGGLPQVTRLSADGASSTPRVVRGVTTTKPGDVQLYRGDLEWFYRPADDTVRRFAPPVAFPARQQVLLTDKGTPVETSLTKRGLFLHTSADGGTTWKRTPVPTIKGVAASRIFVGGGFIWAGLTTISDEGYDVLHFLVRTPETKPGAWERTDLRAHDLLDSSAIGEPEALSNATVLLGERKGWWLLNGEQLSKLDLPDALGTDAGSVWAGVEDDRIWVGGLSGGLFYTDDAGGTWTEVK